MASLTFSQTLIKVNDHNSDHLTSIISPRFHFTRHGRLLPSRKLPGVLRSRASHRAEAMTGESPLHLPCLSTLSIGCSFMGFASCVFHVSLSGSSSNSSRAAETRANDDKLLHIESYKGPLMAQSCFRIFRGDLVSYYPLC